MIRDYALLDRRIRRYSQRVERNDRPGKANPDDSVIRSILSELPQAWNARSAEDWVAQFTEDSDFTNILGMHFGDRDENRARHAALFATIFSDSRLEARVLNVRMIGLDAAVAEVQFTLRGYGTLPPGIQETAPGVLRTRLISVLEKRNGEWWIVAAQNTAILPGR